MVLIVCFQRTQKRRKISMTRLLGISAVSRKPAEAEPKKAEPAQAVTASSGLWLRLSLESRMPWPGPRLWVTPTEDTLTKI
jgi:hypothetical protein